MQTALSKIWNLITMSISNDTDNHTTGTSYLMVWGFGLIGLVSFFFNFHGLYNTEAILVKEQLWYYLTYSWRDKGVHAFPKGLKVTVTPQLEFELTYFKAAVQHFRPKVIWIGVNLSW